MTTLPIQNLWEKHLAEPFPASLAAEEVDGINLALLDGIAAGCISHFLTHEGRLGLRRTATLGLAYRHVAVVARVLEGAAQDYFLRLEDLAHEVLQSVRDAAPEE
ncbi:MAG: hypothetical protein ACJ79S_05930 [Gemmatimonadaceae bacterium]